MRPCQLYCWTSEHREHAQWLFAVYCLCQHPPSLLRTHPLFLFSVISFGKCNITSWSDYPDLSPASGLAHCKPALPRAHIHMKPQHTASHAAIITITKLLAAQRDLGSNPISTTPQLRDLGPVMQPQFLHLKNGDNRNC